MLNAHKNNAGFSLIEITVVVVIGGLLMTAFADMALNAQKEAKIKVTKERLEAVDEALRNYSLTNYRLPCVARRTDPADTANYAVEIGNCNAAVVAGQSFRVAPFGAGTHRIRIGTVPTRTLNLPDTFGYDAWGARFLYAVNELDTNTSTYGSSPNSSIEIVDRNNNAVVTPPGSIRYLVLSHGGDKEGGLNTNGVQINPCAAAELDGENCDNNDSRFRTTTIVSDATTSQQFDDLMSYKGNVRISEIPSGAVMAFRSGSCPQGWSAATDLRGRVIIGTGAYSQPAPPPTMGLSATYTGQTFNLNSVGGSATRRGTNGATDEFRSLPPYVALIYCEKV